MSAADPVAAGSVMALAMVSSVVLVLVTALAVALAGRARGWGDWVPVAALVGLDVLVVVTAMTMGAT